MGSWHEIEVAIWETNVTPCDCCGQVVAKRIWVADVEGTEQRFCGEECEGLFRRYVLPKRKARAAQSGPDSS